MTKLRKAYLDIEATYDGNIPETDRDRFFKDFPNWKFCCEVEHEGKKAKYCGIIGILVLDFEVDDQTHVHRLLDKKFVQLIGEQITKERLMEELDGMNEIIGYHCRTRPSGPKGYTGYDFGVIGAQLGVILDELPGVKCTDLEILCHNAGMYGGLKVIERLIPSIPHRKSGIADGAEAEKILLEVAACEDEIKKKELWKKARMYNHEDVVNLVYIEQWLKKIKMSE